MELGLCFQPSIPQGERSGSPTLTAIETGSSCARIKLTAFVELESAMRAYRDWFDNRTRFLPNRVATRILTRLNEERPDAATKPFQRGAAEGRNHSARTPLCS